MREPGPTRRFFGGVFYVLSGLLAVLIVLDILYANLFSGCGIVETPLTLTGAERGRVFIGIVVKGIPALFFLWLARGIRNRDWSFPIND